MTECYLRVAIVEEPRWLAGTVLEACGLEHEFQSGDMGMFLPLRVKTGKWTFEDMKQWRMKKVVSLKMFMSDDSIGARAAIRENLRKDILSGSKLTVVQSIMTPRFDKVIDLDTPGMLADAPMELQPQPSEELEMP